MSVLNDIANRTQYRRLIALSLLLFCYTGDAQTVTSAFEKLLMPGRVIEDHADIEGDCAACHDVQSDLPQAALCINCHEDVGNDRASATGFHGRFETAQQNECVVCHTDHEGRDADIVPVDAGVFDHQFTDFVLTGAHINASCGDCHAAGQEFRDTDSNCGSCHVDEDIHDGALGTACQDCHSVDTWADTSFDHALTEYPLTGRHQGVACVDCHRGNQFAQTSTSCANCHAVDDVHAGNNGANCQDCHSTSTWQQIGFDHLAETGFALQDGHGGLACNDCHTREDFKDNLDSSCVGCHRNEDDHQGRNGTECETCHLPVTWTETEFDHASTGFPLRDAHAPLHCAACHKESQVADVAAGCGDCHSIDDSHGGQLGDSCGDCHQQTTWLDNIAFDHDLSAYPLNGMHAVAPCAACHDSNRFHDAATECAACHIDDDIHKGGLGEDCSACHTSNDWITSVFDHDTQTAFPLDGAHNGIDCDDCHRDADAALSDVSSNCGGCHRSNDIHSGQFGLQCGQCHDTTSFSNVERL